MKVRRTYRNWDSPDCHINIQKFFNKRIMPFFSPHLHDELEILYFAHGTYEVYRTEGNCRVETGTVYVVMPNEIHSIRSLCEDGEYLALTIEPSAISMNQDHFFQMGFVEPLQTGRLYLPRMFKSSDPGCAELIGYLEQLRQLKEDDPGYFLRRFLYVMGVCTELIPHCSIVQKNNDTGHSGPDIAKRCVLYMHEHYSEKISLSALAEHIHVHPNYLCAAFKKDIGMTVLEYLNRIRVERARVFLRRGDLTISQVAERCGFQSISAFQRTFKANTGTTPSKFAKNFKS